MVNIDIRKFTTLDSTNTYLKALAQNGEKEGVVIIADSQTSGRGRKGKSFFSPQGTGLYMSILLYPDKKISDPTYITTATAVALRRAIKEVYNKSTSIKWVNDIYLEGKKLAGILTEGAFSSDGSFKYIIVGIGVNLTTEAFPDEIKDIAVSLGEDKKEALINSILSHFFKIYEDLNSPEIYKEYVDASFIIGKEIEILGEKMGNGKAIGIDRKFRLEVELENKEHIFLSSGDVSIKVKKD